jgi:hypothetical protein
MGKMDSEGVTASKPIACSSGKNTRLQLRWLWFASSYTYQGLCLHEKVVTVGGDGGNHDRLMFMEIFLSALIMMLIWYLIKHSSTWATCQSKDS